MKLYQVCSPELLPLQFSLLVPICRVEEEAYRRVPREQRLLLLRRPLLRGGPRQAVDWERAEAILGGDTCALAVLASC